MKRTWISCLPLLAALSVPCPAADKVECRAEIERGVLKANEKQTTVIKVTLDAPKPPEEKKRPAVNLCVVLDRSGSMAGKKIDKARQAAVEAVKRLSRDDLFSLVVYDDQIQTLIPAEPVRDVDSMVRRIEQIRDGGNTALFGGVSQGASEIRKHLEGKYVHRVLLLSDGLANVGPSTPDELGRLGASLKKEGVSVTTIGVGEDYNEDLMNRLAGKSDGNTYFVAEAGDLPRIFQAELGDVLSTVASDVIIEITFPEGVKPRRILGREGRVDDGRVEVQMNQLYGGQAKHVLVEVEVEGGENGSTRPVAEARVSYRNRLNDADESAQSSARVRYSSKQEDVDTSVNASVGKERVVVEAADRREQAVKAWESGRKDEAKKLISMNAQSYRTAAGAYAAPALAAEASKEEAYLDTLDASGLTKGARKDIMTRSAQDKNQQLSK